MIHDTVGKQALMLMAKEPDTRSPIELERAMHEDYEKHIYECVERCKKEFPQDFFVVVETKKEKLLQNVVRNFFFGRLSCPTPNYDQTVYRYSRADDKVEFLWVIPARDICQHLKENAVQVAPAERDLLNFVLDFSDGTLFERCKKLNGEVEDSVLLEKH